MVRYCHPLAQQDSSSQPEQMSQVLLAIAAGAWLLTPDWIAASMAAGMWLDEHSFQAEVCSICRSLLAGFPNHEGNYCMDCPD